MFKNEQQYSIKGHKTEFGHRRSFDMYVKGPDRGTDENTGVMIVVQNLDSYANNKFWHDLRSRWANRYNVLAIGVNYQGAAWTKRIFTNNFILSPETILKLVNILPSELRSEELVNDPNRLLSIFVGQDLTRLGIELDQAYDLDFWKNYPDYGFVQALDCIWALGAVRQICQEQGIIIDRKRNYVIGLNEGGHIAQMCGRFAPRTFALIADISGYPFIALQTMLGWEADSIKMKLPVIGGSIDALVKLPKTYGLSEKSRYYVTDDMLQIRNLKNFVVPGSSKYLVIQTEGENQEKSWLCRFMQEKGIDVEYVEMEITVNEDNLAELTEGYIDRYLMPDSPEFLSALGPDDFEMGTSIVFETENGKYILNYATGAPVIEFEGKIVALRADEEIRFEQTGNLMSN